MHSPHAIWTNVLDAIREASPPQAAWPLVQRVIREAPLSVVTECVSLLTTPGLSEWLMPAGIYAARVAPSASFVLPWIHPVAMHLSEADLHSALNRLMPIQKHRQRRPSPLIDMCVILTRRRKPWVADVISAARITRSVSPQWVHAAHQSALCEAITQPTPVMFSILWPLVNASQKDSVWRSLIKHIQDVHQTPTLAVLRTVLCAAPSDTARTLGMTEWISSWTNPDDISQPHVSRAVRATWRAHMRSGGWATEFTRLIVRLRSGVRNLSGVWLHMVLTETPPTPHAVRWVGETLAEADVSRPGIANTSHQSVPGHQMISNTLLWVRRQDILNNVTPPSLPSATKKM